MTTRPNVLFVTLDQFRADALSCAGHPVVRTPTLDAIASEGVRFSNHFAQAAPCAPGRAALYTGTYQMTNRVVANGTPLDDRFDNVARLARRAGYAPTLFGYTDQGVDPRLLTDPADPRLSDYEGILPGFDVALDLPGAGTAWLAWLRDRGVDAGPIGRALETEPERHEDLSQSAYLTDTFLGWLGEREDVSDPWFAHLSYLRPHPPYAAAGRFSRRYDPADVPDPQPVGEPRHGLHGALLRRQLAAPTDPDELRALRAQYFGMVSEVDHQLGRIVDALRRRGEWDTTVVVVTSDHGEQLGDQGLLQKGGWFEASYRILCLVRDPRRGAARGTVVDAFTEAVDVLPTLAELVGEPVPAQCDGYPLTPFLDGRTPPTWRSAAVYEWDWRDTILPAALDGWPWDRRVEQQHLVVRRSADRAYVHFGNGSWRCFDLAADPNWQTLVTDPAIVLAEAQALLDWRGRHLDRTLTGFLLRDGGMGRRPLRRVDAT